MYPMHIRIRSTRLTVLLFALTFVLVQAGKGWNPSDLPSPQNDTLGICGRNGVKSSVCDPDGILSRRDEDALDESINSIAEGTNGFKVALCGDQYEGYQLAVLIIARMNSEYRPNLDNFERAKRFAKSIHEKWGVGDAECQNDVVFFVSIDNRQMYISTGRGARERLTDSRVDGVLEQMRPLMREERYGKAVLTAIERIGEILSDTAPPKDIEWPFGFFVFTALEVMIFLSVCCCLFACASGESEAYSPYVDERRVRNIRANELYSDDGTYSTAPQGERSSNSSMVGSTGHHHNGSSFSYGGGGGGGGGGSS